MGKMKKATKIWLIVAASLTVFGLLTVAFAIVASGFDPFVFGTVEYETNSYEIDEEFEDISIITNTADVTVESSDDSTVRVVCHEESKIKHSVSVEDGTLSIERVDERKWYEYIGIGFNESAGITVYLPDGVYGDLSIDLSTGDTEIGEDFIFESIDIAASTGDVNNYAWATGDIKIKTSTGHITVEGVNAGALDLTASTGNISVEDVDCRGEIKHRSSTGKTSFEDVNCQSLTSVATTGDLSLVGVIVAEALCVERDTGDVRFDGSDAAEILIETDTGDVKGSLLTDKVFLTSTDTGRIKVPESISGGKCKITTDTGNIEITIE